jgi:hypothetical protein
MAATTPVENQGWPVPPPIALGVVRPPPVGGLGFFFSFLFIF